MLVVKRRRAGAQETRYIHMVMNEIELFFRFREGESRYWEEGGTGGAAARQRSGGGPSGGCQPARLGANSSPLLCFVPREPRPSGAYCSRSVRAAADLSSDGWRVWQQGAR